MGIKCLTITYWHEPCVPWLLAGNCSSSTEAADVICIQSWCVSAQSLKPRSWHSSVSPLDINSRCRVYNAHARADISSIYSCTTTPLDFLSHAQHTRWAKNDATNSWQQFCQILFDVQFCFTERFSSKYEVKWSLNIPSHLAYGATLPCETLMSTEQVINDKLQDSVATYLRCSGGCQNQCYQIKKWLLLSLSVKTN